MKTVSILDLHVLSSMQYANSMQLFSGILEDRIPKINKICRIGTITFLKKSQTREENMLKTLKIQGGFFENETELELFSSPYKLSFIYGQNGSGKSTISKAISKAKGDIVEGIDTATIYDENDNECTDTKFIHVFNEDYITSNVKIHEDGLNSIVLLGELGDIEEQIAQCKNTIENKEKETKELKNNLSELNDKKLEKSPLYWYANIKHTLSGTNGWADRERLINGGKRNASVSDSVIESISSLHPTESLQEISDRYNDNFHIYEQVRKNDVNQIPNVPELNICYDVESLQSLLSEKIEKPVLSEREKYLITIINEEGAAQLYKMKSVFSDSKTKTCPFCLQEVSESQKADLVNSVEKVLSKKVDNHKAKLNKLMISDFSAKIEGLDFLESPYYLKSIKALNMVREEISKINEIISIKINHPYTPITDFSTEITEKIKEYEEYRKRLQTDIDKYKKAIAQMEELKGKLITDNKAIAYYEVFGAIEQWKRTNRDLKEEQDKLTKSTDEIESLKKTLNELSSRKKSINIAVDLINDSLRYVFFSKDRMEIKVSGDKYILNIHGKPVKPKNISVGERNIIALCYFFTELITNQAAKDGYSQQLVLIIDDPVSSFDFENKVGIMSFLKYKITEIIKGNHQSQILLMTHNIRCLYDFSKIGEEICIQYKAQGGEKKEIGYKTLELKNKQLMELKIKNKNEYSEMLKTIYDFACSVGESDNLIVGNLMRRVLEAFSTFLYKKGISEVSIDDRILAEIGDPNLIKHFRNLMYRLVLNGDSHMFERTTSLEDVCYFDCLSIEERRRTAREVICFLYLLNEEHVLAHLGIKNRQEIKTNITQWCNSIKGFYSHG